MKPIVQEFENSFTKKKLPEFGPGDTVQISFRVREGDKERIQVFQGVVMQIKGKGMGTTVTVRKISGNVAVERIFPVHSPAVDKIKRVRKGSVRRARLYYLRGLQGKAARIKEDRRGLSKAVLVEAPEPGEAAPAQEKTPEAKDTQTAEAAVKEEPKAEAQAASAPAPKKEPAAKTEESTESKQEDKAEAKAEAAPAEASDSKPE